MLILFRLLWSFILPVLFDALRNNALRYIIYKR